MQNEQPVFEESEMKLPTKQVSAADVPTTLSEPQHHKGLVIIILIGALLLLLIGLFLWYKASQLPTAVPPPAPLRPTAEMNNEPESTTAEAEVESFGAMSTSDELDAIEADLESTNLDSLESELIQIETELEAQL
jgi:hypothetical protein